MTEHALEVKFAELEQIKAQAQVDELQQNVIANFDKLAATDLVISTEVRNKLVATLAKGERTFSLDELSKMFSAQVVKSFANADSAVVYATPRAEGDVSIAFYLQKNGNTASSPKELIFTVA